MSDEYRTPVGARGEWHMKRVVPDAGRASELAAPSGYAALLLQQWDGRIKALSDLQHRYVEQGQYAEAIVARAQWQMVITCYNDLKQHIAGGQARESDERCPAPTGSPPSGD